MNVKLSKTWGQLRPCKCVKPKRHDTPAQAKKYVEGFVGMLAGMCVNGHIWIVPMNPKGVTEVTEGMPCVCGEIKAHYVKCRACGNRKLTQRAHNGAIN